MCQSYIGQLTHMFLVQSLLARHSLHSRTARDTGPMPLYRACQHKRRLCRACQRFPRPERAHGTGPGPPSTAPASTNDACVAPAVSVCCGPSARAAPVQCPLVPRLPAQTTPVSRLPAFAAARARARARGTGPERARGAGPMPLSTCQRLPRPERARHRSRAHKYRASQHKQRLCRACQRFPRPEHVRGTGPMPPSTAPASTNDACLAPTSVCRGPSARARARGTGPERARGAGPMPLSTCQRLPRPEHARHRSRAHKYRASQHKQRLCRACQRFPRPEHVRGTGPMPLSTAPASTSDACVTKDLFATQ